VSQVQHIGRTERETWNLKFILSFEVSQNAEFDLEFRFKPIFIPKLLIPNVLEFGRRIIRRSSSARPPLIRRSSTTCQPTICCPHPKSLLLIRK
jgi:hypothetical protein